MAERADDALSPFLILAKTARGKAAIALIQQVLNHKKVFVFGELLDEPVIQALKGTEDSKHHDLLELFAYGTFAQYKENKAAYPELTDAQQKKLKQLTILSLAQKQRIVPYSLLQEQIDISELRALEDLIIESMYAGLLRGKLDQSASHLEVKYAIGRDIKLDELDAMMAKLKQWADCSSEVITSLEEKKKVAADRYEADKLKQKEQKEQIEKLKLNLKDRHDGDDAQGVPMDTAFYEDDQDRRRRGKRRMPTVFDRSK